MDLVRNLIKEVENLKSEKKFEDALKILEESVQKYNDDYRLYEEIADIYLYE
jgi:ribosome recycling factor